MLRCWMLSCNSTQTTCYAAGCSIGLPQIRHATLLDILLHFHTYVILHCWMFSWTSTHTSCYAAGYSLALPHIRHSTLLDVLLHFHAYVMLRCWMCSCTSTWFVFESPLLRVLLWPEHRLWTDSGIGYKTRFHNTKAADKTSRKFGSTCMLQSGARASTATSWTTSANFVLGTKKGTFRRNPRRTKLHFCAWKTLKFPLLRSPFQRVALQIYSRKIKCANYDSSDISIIVLGLCDQRKGLLQTLLPCFYIM